MSQASTSPAVPQFGFLPAALKALAADPGVFVQNDRLVELVHRPTAQVIPLKYGRLKERLEHNQIWLCHPRRDHNAPPSFFAEFLARGEWPGIKALAGLTDTPVLRREGSILDAPGYDPASALHFEPTVDIALPASPTRDDATRAVALLTKRFAPLPFESDIHRSAFLAAMLTPFARERTGPAPLFFFDAPTDATPTLLADLISHVAHGREIMQFEKPDSERTFRRQLARTQLRGEDLLLVSGAETWRSGGALRTALFSRTWVDGIARRTDPRPVTWLAAGANAQLTKDVAALTLPIRLNSTEDDITGETWGPSPELLRNLQRDRAQLVTAALTILRAFELAGRPDQQLEPWTGFHDWTAHIAAALVWAGAPNPLLARRTAREVMIEEQTPDLRQVFLALAVLEKGDRGLVVTDLIDELSKDSANREPFRRALNSLLPDAWNDPRRVGALLKKHRGRTLNGLRLDHFGEDGNGYARWAVRPIAANDDAPESSDSIHVTDTTPAELVPIASEPRTLVLGQTPTIDDAQLIRSTTSAETSVTRHHTPPPCSARGLTSAAHTDEPSRASS